ncbi:hypothetical protein FRB90_003109, partial [Tulasnella sp. 427]
RPLAKFRMVIESVAWNESTPQSGSAINKAASTREILIGARNGTIYESVIDAHDDFFKSQDRYLNALFTLPDKQPIYGVKFETYSAPDSKSRKGAVLVTTATRIYEFQGPLDKKGEDGGKLFEPLFEPYRAQSGSTPPKFIEIPGNLARSELRFYTPAPTLKDLSINSRQLGWLTGSGAYRGSVPIPPTSDNLIDSASLLHYPSSTDVPIAMCLSEFHFIFLFKDRICAVSSLDERLVWEENLPLKPNETALGLTSDPKSGTYWLFTDVSLFEIEVKEEDRDVWSVYLKQDSYDLALKYAKTAPHRAQVYSAYAKHQFDQGNYIAAAQSYAQSATSFEHIALAFLDLGEQGRDGLRLYLYARLERCGKNELTQRMLLATWLVEFYLSKINTLDDIIASEGVSHDVDNLKAEQALLEDELRAFFDTYKSNMDKKTVYDLILNHGREDVFLYYATVVGDFEKQQNQLTPQSPLSSNQAIRYLQHVVFTARSTSPTIHNLLLTLLVTSSVKRDNPPTSPGVADSSVTAESDLPLLRFLSTAPVDPLTARPYYDLDYALRLCKQHNRLQACVHIYAKMAMWEESVDLALEMKDLELAKVNCERATEDATTAGASGDEGLRKRLWLKVAKFVVQEQNDIKTALKLLDNTPLVKIEDILPFFPDFVVIDDFKEEICNALEGYSAHIDSLKAEMDEATKSAEAIKNDIKNLQNRFVTLEATEKCSICGLNLLTRQFYVFPCQHCFHADCLIGQVKEYLPAPSLRRLITLQNTLVQMQLTGLLPGNPAAPPAAPTNRPATPPVPPNRANSQPQRTLLSAAFNPLDPAGMLINPAVRLASALNPMNMPRNLGAAGDRLRDLIVPDALANAIGAGVSNLPGVGLLWGAGDDKQTKKTDAEAKAEKIRDELDDLLAASCPLCEGVVVGLDKPFISPGEVDDSWAL